VSLEACKVKAASDRWLAANHLDAVALEVTQSVLVRGFDRADALVISTQLRKLSEKELLMCDQLPAGGNTLEGLRGPFEYVNDVRVSGEHGGPSVAKLLDSIIVGDYVTYYSHDENVRQTQTARRKWANSTKTGVKSSARARPAI
jgi:hypothetical protein